MIAYGALLAICCVGADPTLETLVAAHDNAIAGIHSLDVKVTEWQGGQKAAVSHWSKEGNLERIQRVLTLPDPTTNKAQRRLSDIFHDGTNSRGTNGVEPGKKYKLTLLDQQRLSGMISPQTGEMLMASRALRQRLLLSAQATVSEETLQTLGDLIKASQAKFGPEGAKLIGQVKVGDHLAWQIHVRHLGLTLNPDVVAGSLATDLDFFLAPEKNFMLCRIDNVTKVENEEQSSHFRREVVSFQDCGNGVFFPKEVVQSSFDGLGNLITRSEAKMEVTEITVNQPLSPKLFDFEFPEGLLVQIHPPKAGRLDHHLMGEKNEIIRTYLAEMNDLNRERDELFAQGRMNLRKRSWLWPILGVVTGAVALATLLYRRRQNQKF